ncbi:T9SS type A sorting domain-containing protein [Saprospiraceae bacterium]|nr:T9SS type A sorting domain-containing protein [Saprospiraceae bacterium]
MIIDSANLGCSSAIEIGEVCCGIGDCFIGEISIETECTSTTTYNLIFDIEGSMATSDSFDVIFNGINLATFAYNSLPGILENLPADCDLELNFTIVDSENEGCFEEVNMDPVCCEEECEIEIEGLSVIECNEGEVTLVVEFNSSGIEEPGVTLYINDVIVGEAGVDAESIELTGYVSNDPQLGIVICQSETLSCCAGINIANPCYVDSVEDELDQIDWKVASNLLALTNNSSSQLNIQIMSYTGVVLAKSTVDTNSESRMDMSNLPAGLYLLHMTNDKGQRTEKFVVR